ncbi:MAG: ribonuclease H-like domain-containing protein [Armatimonadetes bacterium]|nr:ribonuclease H-like domain-containing protein [Armatimonadota bacterium]
MLEKSFIHIPGIGRDTEKAMWAQGCDSWDTYLAQPNEFRVGSAGRDLVKKTLERSKLALERGEHQYFRKKLGTKEAWRAWPNFKDSCAYLDIETDGNRMGQSVTIIGIHDGEFKVYVKGENLEAFRNDITNYNMIVSFFGTGFDIPVLQRKFPSIQFDHIHIDLCFTLKALGYRGGLKKIEKEVGIIRPEGVAGLSGWDAVLLWRRHLAGDPHALQTLIDYNKEDVVNLETLAKIAYQQTSERHWTTSQLKLPL